MTTLADLRRLALAATPGPWTYARMRTGHSEATFFDNDAEYVAACFPDRILALLDVIEAAKAMRDRARYEVAGELFRTCKAFDAALDALEQEGR